MLRKKLYFFTLAICGCGYLWLFFNLYHHAVANKGFIGCLFHKTTGIPCPSCGSTRSVLSLIRGDFFDALYYNPLGILIFVIMIVFPFWIFSDLALKKDSFFRFYKIMEQFLIKKQIAFFCIALILINWIWNIFKFI